MNILLRDKFEITYSKKYTVKKLQLAYYIV